MKFPLIATEYYAFKSVPSVESIKLMTLIKAKMGQNGRGSKCAINISFEEHILR